jgi:hypothetical protein
MFSSIWMSLPYLNLSLLSLCFLAFEYHNRTRIFDCFLAVLASECLSRIRIFVCFLAFRKVMHCSIVFGFLCLLAMNSSVVSVFMFSDTDIISKKKYLTVYINKYAYFDRLYFQYDMQSSHCKNLHGFEQSFPKDKKKYI